ncbi:HNH endonuclease [Arthrobacter crystallopoietes BAB-32]|uniref:HNH endonuclease n=2 Tax=Crystallibacter crystallopoietes TaxID=37928 RepID=N1UUM6_9MICC|nr:HNH endonuclease [Arthrobacter crystallopoietes BAB-32]
MEASLLDIRVALQDLAARFRAEGASLSIPNLVAVVAAVEDVSKVVDSFQVAGAYAVDATDVATWGEASTNGGSVPGTSGTEVWSDPARAIRQEDVNDRAGRGAGDRKRRKTEFANNAEYLRARLRIGIVEARRRIRVGKAVAVPVRLDGEPGTPARPALAEAVAAGAVRGAAAALVADSIARASHAAGSDTLEAMESCLVQQATETDADTLAMVAKTWETAVDQDGAEPSEEELKARQGVFYRGRRRGLHQFVINATDEQYEAVATAMNTATNPRIRSDAIESAAAAGSGTGTSRTGDGQAVFSGTSAAGQSSDAGGDGQTCERETVAVAPAVLEGLDDFTRAQKLLAGLIGACKIALNTGQLPDSGGHRAQVIVTTAYEQLAGLLTGGATAVFNGPISATAARRMACDAEIIPAVLGSKGEVLDLGRSQRFFNRATRRALVARDKGCAFPGCTMPAFWTEAHHIVPWWSGGHTSVSNGVCLCILHHDLIEQGNWTITVTDGIPWFTPPAYIDPDRRPLRNTYWQTRIPPRSPGP